MEVKRTEEICSIERSIRAWLWNLRGIYTYQQRANTRASEVKAELDPAGSSFRIVLTTTIAGKCNESAFYPCFQMITSRKGHAARPFRQ